MKGGERLNLLIISDDNKVYTLYSHVQGIAFWTAATRGLCALLPVICTGFELFLGLLRPFSHTNRLSLLHSH
jgi:hypothetical protein